MKLDGAPESDCDAIISIKSPLSRIFLNRTPGEPLKLEVLTHRTEQFTLRAQRDSPPGTR